MKTFTHKFSTTVSATFQVGDTPPEKGKIDDRNVIWEGKPKPKHMREYIRWMNEINRQLADEWNMRMIQVFMLSENKWETWGYAPGQSPELLKDKEKTEEEPIHEENGESVTTFGPFLNVPVDSIKAAGFTCQACHVPVRVFRQVVPEVVPRMVFHACKCGTVVTWEDENQPKSSNWQNSIDLMKESDTQVIVYNGNKRTPPSFSGIN